VPDQESKFERRPPDQNGLVATRCLQCGIELTTLPEKVSDQALPQGTPGLTGIASHL
jgi:hypothetical protein